MELSFLLGSWIILRPDPLELIKMVGTQNGPVPSEIVKIVHDDSNKEVNDLIDKRGDSESKKSEASSLIL